MNLKKKYWGVPEWWNHKMLTRKILPYFLIVKMLDKSIKLWDPESGMEEVQHIFCLADQLIKRWKMDWNGMHGESFQQSYFGSADENSAVAFSADCRNWIFLCCV